MLIDKKTYTKTEFYEFIQLPQHADRVFELINGEIYEKMPTFGYSSGTGARVTTFIGIYLLDNDIAYFTDAQGGYDIDDENTFAPDVGIILKSRLAKLPTDQNILLVPDFVVEVVSISDQKAHKDRIEKKLNKYIKAGVWLIWYIYPDHKEVEVYKRGQPMRVVGIDGVLDGGDVLPNFTLPVRDIFPA
jgi:Uma2 family endonuclease